MSSTAILEAAVHPWHGMHFVIWLHADWIGARQMLWGDLYDTMRGRR